MMSISEDPLTIFAKAYRRQFEREREALDRLADRRRMHVLEGIVKRLPLR